MLKDKYLQYEINMATDINESIYILADEIGLVRDKNWRTKG